MTSSTSPWYLSITARWQDSAGFTDLQNTVKQFAHELPAQHKPMPHEVWHHTVLAIATFREPPTAGDSEGFAVELLDRLCAMRPAVVDRLEEGFAPLELDVHEITCWNAGTTLQLRGVSDALTRLREHSVSVLRDPVNELCRQVNDAAGYALLSDLITPGSAKNVGPDAYGSIARATDFSGPLAQLWRRPIPPVRLRFGHVLLLHSDHALTNPRAVECARVICAK